MDEALSKIWAKVYSYERDRLIDTYLETGIRPVEKLDQVARTKADEAVARARKRGTTERWAVIRKRIWLRDGPTCQVCHKAVSWDQHECGHIIDRVCGGTDLDDNLVVMCNFCNRVLKPCHATREEYEEWCKNPWAGLLNYLYL